jgi:hypothetical protein
LIAAGIELKSRALCHGVCSCIVAKLIFKYIVGNYKKHFHCSITRTITIRIA